MMQNRVGAFVRTMMVLALALFGAGALSAQTGKITGTVKTASGGPVAEATVQVVGTVYQTQTNKDGYYFFNNVPPGQVDIRVTAVGFRAQTMQGIRVAIGQTYAAQDIILEQAGAVQIADVQVTSAANSLIQRDKQQTRQSIDPDFVNNVAEARVSSMLSLMPGITRALTGDTTRLSVRGSRYTENNMYVDGVPVQRFSGSGVEFEIGIGAFEEASMITGAASGQYGNALGGNLVLATRSGSSAFRGQLSWDTGMLGGAYATGTNAFGASIGGPTPIKNLVFNVTARLEGRTWSNNGYQGWLWPGYTTMGIDTTFRVPYGNAITTSSFNNARADSIDLSVYKTAVISGDCDNFWFVKNAALAEMRDNYGVSCEKNRSFTAPQTTYQTSSRLDYTFGRGSRLTLSYNWNGNQSRPRLLADGRQQGTIQGAGIGTLTWNQRLFQRGNQSLSVQASYSIQDNNRTSGPMTVASEKATRNPFSGFMLTKMDLIYGRDDFQIDSNIVKAFLTQAQYRTGLIPALLPNTGAVSGASVGSATIGDGVPYRSANGGGGNDVTLSWNAERRKVLRVALDAQVNQWNRLLVGYGRTEGDIKTLGTNVSTSNWYRPVLWEAYLNNDIDLNDVLINFSLRYDEFDYNLKRWVDFPRISSLPEFDKENPDLVMREDRVHGALQPRIGVSFPVTQKTNFFLNYGQTAQAPSFSSVATNHKYDIDRSGINSRSAFGDDVSYARTVSFEFGVAHAFNDDMTLDLSFYNKDNLANIGYKYGWRIDPLINELAQLNLLVNTDFGNARGVEASLNRRIGQYMNGRLSYSYADIRNTGSTTGGFYNFFESIGEGRVEPPLQPLPTTTSVPHKLNAVAQLSLPATFKRGTLFGKVAGGLSVNASLGIQSGTPYTRCDARYQTNMEVLSDAASPCDLLEGVQGFMASRLPMSKTMTTRFQKQFQVGRRTMSAYLDINNPFNWTNVYRVYATTGTTTSPVLRTTDWATDSLAFVTAAINHGFLGGGSSMVLPASTAACAKVGSSTNSLVLSCFAWIRSEQRFGNGDGVYTLDEWARVSDLVRGPSRTKANFLTGARTMRFGLRINL